MTIRIGIGKDNYQDNCQDWNWRIITIIIRIGIAELSGLALENVEDDYHNYHEKTIITIMIKIGIGELSQ